MTKIFAFRMPSVVALGAFYLAYLLAAAFGRWITVASDIPIIVWPPNGIVLALLLMQRRSTWPWWLAVGAVGELTGNVIWFHNPLLWAVGYVIANATAVLTAAFLFGRLLPGPLLRFANLTHVLAFLVVGVLIAPIISATLGSAIDAVVGKNPFTVTWPVWWLGDATGILLATPLTISAINASREKARPTATQLLEGLAIALSLAVLNALEMATGTAFAFLLLLPIVWAALRFEFRGATIAVLGLAVAIGVHGKSAQIGQTAGDLAMLQISLQALLLVAASTGLAVAAISREQRQSSLELARMNEQLETRVIERTKALKAAETMFRATFQNAGVGIGIVTGDGQLARVNDSMLRMLGYSKGEMEEHPIEAFTHPDDRLAGAEALERLTRGTSDEYELEKRYIRKDGTVVWGHTTVSCVRNADGSIDYLIKIIQDITSRKRSEEVRKLLMREVSHRTKNLLAIIQVIARRSTAKSFNEFVTTFNQRLSALAANQDLLVKSDWQSVNLTELVRSQLDHFEPTKSRISMSGPDLIITPSAAQALGLALNELVTNAIKYGSLSNADGIVEIGWTVVGDQFTMSWRETGGPEVEQPTATGFGAVVLDKMAASALGGEVIIDYETSGLNWQVLCPLASVQE